MADMPSRFVTLIFAPFSMRYDAASRRCKMVYRVVMSFFFARFISGVLPKTSWWGPTAQQHERSSVRRHNTASARE
jgi:hypothetical protein